MHPCARRQTTAACTVALLAAIAFPTAVCGQSPTYNAASLNGGYAYNISGYSYDPYSDWDDLITEGGQLTADGAGNVSGSDTVLINGSLVRRTFTGNYAINPDGTGTLVLFPSWGPQIDADMVVGDNGHTVKLVVTDSGNALTGTLESQNPNGQAMPQSYNTSTFTGGYEYKIDGYTVDSYGNVAPISEVGRLSSDGAGNVTGTSTVSIDGYVVRRTFTGTYFINPNGSGSFILYPTWGPAINADIFLSCNGLKFNFVITDSTNNLSGVMTAQVMPSQSTGSPMQVSQRK